MKVFSVSPPRVNQPASLSRLPGFRRKPIALKDAASRWRKTLQLLDLDEGVRHKAEAKLEWLIFYYTVAGKDTYQTARYFGITAKTIYKWVGRFESSGQKVSSLIEMSRRPKHLRSWTVSLEEQARIRTLRKAHLHWGKCKLRTLYRDQYGTVISTWKIERVIRRFDLYPAPRPPGRARIGTKPKLRITQFAAVPTLFSLIHVDGIVIYWQGTKRYIFTAVDDVSKLGYARMYPSKSSKSAKDFLYRLHYLIQAPLPNIQTDEGSEFKGDFDVALTTLHSLHWFSRVKTPKDNAEVERFNQTLQYEWLNDGHMTTNCLQFNQALTKWLVEYNNVRPHQTLAYQTPLAFLERSLLQSDQSPPSDLLPMYPARTDH